MIQKIKNSLVILATVFAFAAPAMVPATVRAAEINDNLCTGANLQIDANSRGNCPGAGDASSLNALLAKIVNIISAVVGVVAVIMIVVGGFKYITSGGDSNNVSGAKNTIIYAIIGLVIVALAQVIVRFVLNQSETVTG